MNTLGPYPIGELGKAWGETEKQEWYQAQEVKRSYEKDVLSALEQIEPHMEKKSYGTLNYSEKSYPQYVLTNTDWADDKPLVLITGGVHGYETSGVHGALRFAQETLKQYTQHFNFVIFPCVSPWGYETINRWNPDAIDPNRSFYPNSPAKECSSVMQEVAQYTRPVLAHFDLHETTDTDATEFRPALAARDGKKLEAEAIPDGFYSVADPANYCADFQKAIIDSVENVTHIAPPDKDGKILEVKEAQRGVILYPAQDIHLCMALSRPKHSCTTEVYPDSPKTNDENCIEAQVAALTGGLDYLKKIDS